MTGLCQCPLSGTSHGVNSQLIMYNRSHMNNTGFGTDLQLITPITLGSLITH